MFNLIIISETQTSIYKKIVMIDFQFNLLFEIFCFGLYLIFLHIYYISLLNQNIDNFI